MSKMSKGRKLKKLKEKTIKKKSNRINNLTISVAMIIKNEEKHIVRCLRSIVDLFKYEIIIIDTGSTDKTLELVRGIAEHHPQIKLHELKDIADVNDYYENTEFGPKLHMSKARNLCISYCMGDWIIIIDADEKVINNQSSIEQLKEFIVIEAESKNFKSIAFSLYDIHNQRSGMQFNSVRVFKKRSIEYEGRIHNRPMVDGDSIFCPYLYYFHYGYDLTYSERKSKEERTCGLLEKDLEENSDNTRAMYFLVQSYAWHGRKAEAISMGRKYLSYKDKGTFNGGKQNFNPGVYYPMIRMLVNEGISEKNNDTMTEARKLLEQATKELPTSLDIFQCMVEFGAVNGEAAYIQAGARGFMREYEKFDVTAQGEQFIHTYTPDAYCYCVYQLARYQVKESEQLLKRVGSMLGATEPKFAVNLATSINKDLEEIDKCKIAMK